VPANATLEQILPYTKQVFKDFQSEPEFDHSFQITFANGGFGGMLAKPWDERKRSIFPIQEELKREAHAHLRRPRAGVPAVGAPERGLFPVEFVIASTASHEELVRFAERLVQEAVKSGQFAFRRSWTCASTRRRGRSSSIATRSRRWA